MTGILVTIIERWNLCTKGSGCLQFSGKLLEPPRSDGEAAQEVSHFPDNRENSTDSQSPNTWVRSGSSGLQKSAGMGED